MNESSEDTPNKYTILIVDDEIIVRHTIGDMLQLLDTIVLYAEKAEKAFEILRNHDIDLIILDALLPDMDGFQTASAIRKMNKTKDIPIIMMSGIYKKMKYKYHAKEAGINIFISKPVDINTLLREVRKLLNISEEQ